MATRKPARKTSAISIPEYKLRVSGKDRKLRKRIAETLKRGISKAADVCKLSPPVCVDNLELPRSEMPQIEAKLSARELLASDDAENRAKGRAIVQAGGKKSNTLTIKDQMLNRLEAAGVKTWRKRIPVGELKATQEEIQAAKVYGMALSHIDKAFPDIAANIIVSRDNHILDGHHRWAALLTLNPANNMNVTKVDLPIRELLHEAAATPGVYRADFEGKPLSAAKQKQYKRDHKTRLRKRKSAARTKPRKRLTRAEQQRRLRAAIG